MVFWVNGLNAQGKYAPNKIGIQKAGNIAIGLGLPGNEQYGPVHGFMTFASSDFHSFEDAHRQVILHSSWKVKHIASLNLAYYVTRRLSVGAEVKYWEYTQKWDTNGVHFNGRFQKIAFPVFLRYDLVRKRLWNLRLGIGFEICHEKYASAGYFKPTSNWDKLDALFSGKYVDDGDIEVLNEYHFINRPDKIIFGDIAGSIRISKKWSAELSIRTGTNAGSNHYQLGVVYTLFNAPHIPFERLKKKK
jgi:hypothetical protein